MVCQQLDVNKKIAKSGVKSQDSIRLQRIICQIDREIHFSIIFVENKKEAYESS